MARNIIIPHLIIVFDNNSNMPHIEFYIQYGEHEQKKSQE